KCRDLIECFLTAEGNPAGQASARRHRKEMMYLRLPPFWRSALYWGYRYFARLGFLDGQAGLIYHFLQAFWYRFLVDAKLWELAQSERQPSVKAAAGLFSR